MAGTRQREDVLRSVKIDIVGDFAGQSLFGIQGEAMLTHCLEEACLDFDYGFKLLHAVHAVETLLKNLKDRGCVFHVLWFDQEADICMLSHAAARPAWASKYRLTRVILIQHLSRPFDLGNGNATTISYVFPGLESHAFREYLDGNLLAFFSAPPWAWGIIRAKLAGEH